MNFLKLFDENAPYVGNIIFGVNCAIFHVLKKIIPVLFVITFEQRDVLPISLGFKHENRGNQKTNFSKCLEESIKQSSF